MIRLFVGLGNPGPEYEGTRHNAGFWFVDEVSRALKTTLSMDKNYHGLLARTTVDGQTVWLLKPQTYMNLSGKSVGGLARFFKIQPEEILVAHDELDLPPGEAKLKLGGNHAGHNGLRDIHAQLGSDRYWRLRLGVGHPGLKAEVVNWVLKKPSLDHRIAIDQTIDRAVKALPHFFSNEMEKATMQIHTSKPPRPKPAKPANTPAQIDIDRPQPPKDPPCTLVS
ncbi:aminoacyl-tRNA hydrolase [Rhodoferax sp. PAMC 29310]|uniref:aminoacyl-tRNA hydrolase n=1 Tax=Rhodoferax sp. PAMC 29310 TaxID=2822760 RepID=UPI001B324785|nr:aminoacyl-tRNA hydrolase [Rhodoferax sp. PAMC 29310]